MLTSSISKLSLCYLALLLPHDVCITSDYHVTETREVCDHHGVLGQDICGIILTTYPLEIELLLQESIEDVQLSQIYELGLILLD